ncbi:hypothetical protein GCM10022280_20490 [Sphingomonas swuensis]|uniref:Lipoprotein n=1 Tax=Sphingomonas swuensis TaxID=977800 RepID=A0ABP7T2K2_9SPHN
MRKLARATGLLIAALSLGGCQYAFPLDLVQRDGKLLIWTEREWKWFLIPERPRMTVRCIEVWSGRNWMWQLEAPEGREIQLPIAYGEARPGLTVVHSPRPLTLGLGYVARVDMADGRSFRLSQSGELIDVVRAGWEGSPDEKAMSDLRDRRIKALRASGLTEEQAYETWNLEQPPSAAVSQCGRLASAVAPRS